MAASDTRPSMRAVAAVMRATADRFDAIRAKRWLTELEVLRWLAIEADELHRAVETLDRELEEMPD